MASVTPKDKGREPFVTSIYVPNTEKPGYLKFERMATVGELYDYCKAALEEAGILERLDYFHIVRGDSEEERAVPLPDELRWLVVFAVTGASEGFYIHVEVIYPGSRKLLILGKDLGSKMDTALQAVNVLAPLLS
ncbi:MAG: hypothetical protein WC405_19910 [Syntrophales bacterium]